VTNSTSEEERSEEDGCGGNEDVEMDGGSHQKRSN